MPITTISEAINAARAGDCEELQQWLSKGNSPDGYNSEGWTPLLAACARGRSDVVALLLGYTPPADVGLSHRKTEALPIHMAGQAGNLEVVERLLTKAPEHLDAAWELNGHTLLLQAVFFGHIELTELALRRGANAAATTVRGLGALELAQQFDNQELAAIVRPFDRSAPDKAAYYKALLKRIAPLHDRLVTTIEDGVMDTDANDGSAPAVMEAIRKMADDGHAGVNALGGPLQQPPLVVAVTGNNGKPANPFRAMLRLQIAEFLLERGANPLVQERHPMAVNAIVRAAVFNHLDILKRMAGSITAQQLAAALNERPAVNGMTALHDTVLRASSAAPDVRPGYVEQIKWFMARGAQSNIEDFAGRTQRDLAMAVQDANVRRILLDALDG